MAITRYLPDADAVSQPLPLVADPSLVAANSDDSILRYAETSDPSSLTIPDDATLITYRGLTEAQVAEVGEIAEAEVGISHHGAAVAAKLERDVDAAYGEIPRGHIGEIKRELEDAQAAATAMTAAYATIRTADGESSDAVTAAEDAMEAAKDLVIYHMDRLHHAVQAVRSQRPVIHGRLVDALHPLDADALKRHGAHIRAQSVAYVCMSVVDISDIDPDGERVTLTDVGSWLESIPSDNRGQIMAEMLTHARRRTTMTAAGKASWSPQFGSRGGDRS